MSDSVYIPTEDWGTCEVCGKYDDRRFKACFDCSDFVVTDGSFAWDIRNEDRKWPVTKH